jgi:hypothetical protein
MNWRKTKLQCRNPRINTAPYNAQTCISVAAVFAILLLAYSLGHGQTTEDDAKPLSKEQVAELTGPSWPATLTWKKFLGIDFSIYYGRNQEKPSEAVGIYLGGYPPFMNDASLPKKPGRLGMYEVTWQRRDNLRHPGFAVWETVVSLHSDYWKAAVTVEAKDQAGFDKLVAEISQFPMFTQMPRPVGAP